MTSALVQVRMTNDQLSGFVTPASQDKVRPQNCTAVTAQLLKLITPETANVISFANKPEFVETWRKHMQVLIADTISIESQTFTPETFPQMFKGLFPGFATFVVSTDQQTSHAFVVGRFLNGKLVILDPQIRKGYFNIRKYFKEVRPMDTRILVLRTSTLREESYYDDFTVYLERNVLGICDTNTKPYLMDEDPPSSTDIEMKVGGRKRRRTKRRSFAKHTLRRMNRRRRIF